MARRFISVTGAVSERCFDSLSRSGSELQVVMLLILVIHMEMLAGEKRRRMEDLARRGREEGWRTKEKEGMRKECEEKRGEKWRKAKDGRNKGK